MEATNVTVTATTFTGERGGAGSVGVMDDRGTEGREEGGSVGLRWQNKCYEGGIEGELR